MSIEIGVVFWLFKVFVLIFNEVHGADLLWFLIFNLLPVILDICLLLFSLVTKLNELFFLSQGV